MDIEFDGGGVLIEEIQNDWLCEMTYYYRLVCDPCGMTNDRMIAASLSGNMVLSEPGTLLKNMR